MTGFQQTPPSAVVLVAAGKGERLGGELPKQFAPLAGEPLFVHSLRVFAALEFVKEIIVVVPTAGVPEEVKHALAAKFKNVQSVNGGARRQDSVAAGLAALKSDYRVALVHDAARPFPDAAAIRAAALAAIECGGALLAQRVVDTVKRADAKGNAAETLDRSQLWLAQTPQAIRRDYVARAIEEMRDESRTITDEAMLLESWSVPVRLVESSPENFKVTLPGDFARAEALLRMRGDK